MDEAAVLDAPVADAAPPEIDPVDTGADASIDTSEQGEQAQGEQPDAAPRPELEEAEGLIVDGKPSAKVTQLLQKTRAEDPKLAAQIREALFGASKYGQLFPGGIKEAAQLHQRFQELGGEAGLTEMRGNLDFFQGIDADFTAGNPRFVEALAEADPAAFAKIAPAVMAKYEAMHPEAINSFVCQKALAELDKSDFRFYMRMIYSKLDHSDKDSVESFDAIANAYNRMSENAAKKPEVPGKQAPAGGEKDGEYKTREENVIRSEWRVEQNQFRRAEFSSEYDKLAKDRKVNSDNASAIKELCAGRIEKALSGNAEFNSKLQRYFEARDKDGFLKSFNTQYKTILKAEMQRSFDHVMGAKRGPAAGASPVNGKGAPVATPGIIEKGYAWVPKQPGTSEFDMTNPLNNRESFSQGKAILRDGRKVQWRNK